MAMTTVTANNADGFAKKASDIDEYGNDSSMRRASSKRQTASATDRALSHERKPSYSSSERSLPLSISSQATSAATTSPTLPASINPVKMRESAAIRRQRRIGMGYKEEPNNSSSGNWSASSESGRTSIGSEITVQPKSSASSNSLHTSHHPGSAPPSSVISRRRFFNTSASSSVTSEGTATPEQMQELMFDDMETCSAYSCDTEGYYTSFHVDSGLKTLKEEEPSTPLHISSALSSTNSFSSGNQTVVENEYELFGRGSTSTTASSAGTICTTLMGGCGSDRSSFSGGGGPSVPERKSSLTKLNRSNSTTSSNRNSMEPLERSRSSSTMGSASTLDRMGTIKRNGVLLPKEITVVTTVHKNATTSTTSASTKPDVRLDSPDSGNNTSTSPVDSNPNSISPPGVRSGSEFEYSESSDLENMDRSERIRTKTTINSSRIPSMCVITPSNSDDETTCSSASPHSQQDSKNSSSESARAKLATPLLSEKRKLLIETDLDQLDYYSSSPVIVNDLKKEPQVQHVKKTTLLPLNTVFGRLKGALNRKSPLKSPGATTVPAEQIYDVAGEYVTISDTRNTKKNANGVYYANDLVKNNLATVLSGNLNDETEYVSLNELPCNIRCERPLSTRAKMDSSSTTTKSTLAKSTEGDESSNNNNVVHGARVKLDAQGKVIYNSDSLRRRKGAHTTFAPGTCVKSQEESPTDVKTNNGPAVVQLRTPILARPERRVTGSQSGQAAAEHPPKIENSISANRNILAGRLIRQQQVIGSVAVNGVVADKRLHDSHYSSPGVLLQSPTTPSHPVVPLSPLEEEEGLHLLKMIPNSMGPLKNSGAYSTLPKLGNGHQQQQQIHQQSTGKRPLRIIDNLQTHCKSSCVNSSNNNNNNTTGIVNGGEEDADGYSLLALSNLTNSNNNNTIIASPPSNLNHHYHLPQFKHPINPNLSIEPPGNLIRRNSYRMATDFDVEDAKFMATLESHLILPRYLAGLRDAAAVGIRDAVIAVNEMKGVEAKKPEEMDLSDEDEEEEDDDVYSTRGRIQGKQSVSSSSIAAAAVLSPKKVIIPADRYQHRAKFLESNSTANKKVTVAFDTDIW